MSAEDFSIDGRPVSDLRVVDLKDLLEKRGLSKTGSKNVLIKRLKDELVLEKQQELASKNPDSAPNMDMKSCGSNIVTQYLEKQQQALLAAKKAAREARAASGDRTSSCSADESTPAPLRPDKNGTGVEESIDNEQKTASDADVVQSPPPSTLTSVAVTSESVTAVSDHTTAEESLAEAISTLPSLPHVELSTGSNTVDVVEAVQAAKKSLDVEATPVESDKVVAKVESDITAVMVVPDTAAVTVESDTDVAAVKSNTVTTTMESDTAVVDMDTAAKVQINGESAVLETVPGATDVVELVDVDMPETAATKLAPAVESDAEERTSGDGDETAMVVDKSPLPAMWHDAEEEEGEEIEEEDDDDRRRPGRRTGRFDSEKPTAPVEYATNTGVREEEKLQATETAAEKPLKKRRWGSTTMGKKATVSITSDNLKEIVGHVNTNNVVVEDAMLTTTMEEHVQLDYDEEPVPKRIVVSRDEADDEDSMLDESVREESVKIKVSQNKAEKPKLVTEPTFDDGYKRDRSPSPARHPPSKILHIRCLTRPFTIKGLHHFLNRFGAFVERDFWIDSIKSHCFVSYETEEAATAARNKLDNIIWPLTNPNRLRVDFAREIDLERYRGQGSKENNRPVVNAAGVSAQSTNDKIKTKERIVKQVSVAEADKIKRSFERERSPSRTQDNKLWPRSREWDKGKDAARFDRSPSPKQQRLDWRKLPSPPPGKNREINAPAPTVKLLEDLFRKTKAKPFIYWLPLSEEQINERTKSSRSDKEDRKIELLKKMAVGEETSMETTGSDSRRRGASFYATSDRDRDYYASTGGGSRSDDRRRYR